MQEEILNAMRPRDSSPIIAPINSNSQKSQRQVFKMVNFPNKEKLSTTAVKGNEPDQSNQPSYRVIWKPPPWPILKVNSNDAIFREQNYVGVGVDQPPHRAIWLKSTDAAGWVAHPSPTRRDAGRGVRRG